MVEEMSGREGARGPSEVEVGRKKEAAEGQGQGQGQGDGETETEEETEGETLLCVDVIGARNLPSLTQALEGGRAPRLYLVIKHGKQRACTALVKATKQPQWNQKFVFKLNSNQKNRKGNSTPTKQKQKQKPPEGSSEGSHTQTQTQDWHHHKNAANRFLPSSSSSSPSDALSLPSSPSAKKPKSKKKDHLFFSMFTCDAHNDVVEAALTARIRGDGPSLISSEMKKRRKKEEAKTSSSTISRQRDRKDVNNKSGDGDANDSTRKNNTLFPPTPPHHHHHALDLSTTGASIPMPIRTIGKTVVLLHGPDAAPLQKRKRRRRRRRKNSDNVSRQDSHSVPIEWLDIIPTHGSGIHGRSGNIPLFTFGQLGVKIYVQEDRDSPDSDSDSDSELDSASASASGNNELFSSVVEKKEEEDEGIADHEASASFDPLQDTTSSASASASAKNEKETMMMTMAEPEGKDEEKRDDACCRGNDLQKLQEEEEEEEEGVSPDCRIKKKWQPPSSVDWTAIGATLAKETPLLETNHHIRRNLNVELPRHVGSGVRGFKEGILRDSSDFGNRNSVEKEKEKEGSCKLVVAIALRIFSLVLLGILGRYCCMYTSTEVSQIVRLKLGILHGRVLLLVPVADRFTRVMLMIVHNAWLLFNERVVQAMASSNLTDSCGSESQHFFFPTHSA